ACRDVARQPQRRHVRRRALPRRPGIRRAVPPGGISRTARRALPVRPVRRVDGGLMPAKKKPAKAAPKKKAAKRVSVGGLRTLGDVEPSAKAKPKRPKTDAALAGKARATLQKEFDAALALKEKLAAEAAIGS